MVGDLKKLNEYDLTNRSRSRFHSFITTLQCRVNDSTGELDLDSEDLAKMRLHARQEHKKRLQLIFQRPLCDTFDC